MIHETYICSKADCVWEYGFTFKDQEGDEDTLFDLVLGEIVYNAADADATIEASWKANEWAAIAICAAANRKD